MSSQDEQPRSQDLRHGLRHGQYAVWPDWAIFEKPTVPIFLQKFPNYLAILGYFKNTTFGQLLDKKGHFLYPDLAAKSVWEDLLT